MFNKLIAISTIAFIGMSQANANYYDNCHPPQSAYKNVSCTPIEYLFYGMDDKVLINTKDEKVVNVSLYDTVDIHQANDGLIPVIKSSKIGYINYQGKPVIPLIYDSLYNPDNKYSEIEAYQSSQGAITVMKDGEMGVINTSNQIIVPFGKYDEIDGYAEGNAAFLTTNNHKWGVLDNKGNVVVSTKYDALYSTYAGNIGFSDGLLAVLKNGKWGYITNTGKVAVPFIYDEVRPFSEQYAGVMNNGKWGFINGANKTMLSFKYPDSKVERYGMNYNGANYFVFNDGQAIVSSSKGEYCINKLGKSMKCS